MTPQIIPVDNEPRIRDTDLAAYLGLEKTSHLRQIIKRNIEELEGLGGLPLKAVNPGPKGGRPGAEYLLNEKQAALLCMFSQGKKASEARKEIVEVFVAWRAGKIVPVKKHYRRPPNACQVHPNFSMEMIDRDVWRVFGIVTGAMAIALAETYGKGLQR